MNNSQRTDFVYCKKFYDENFEYRQVMVSKEIGKMVTEKGLMSEEQWRSLGISMSKGWVHYTIYRLEPHIMLFRRPIGTDGSTGLVSQELKNELLQNYYINRKKIPSKFN